MWDLALSLTLAWVITFFALFKGIKTSGKVDFTDCNNYWLNYLQ